MGQTPLERQLPDLWRDERSIFENRCLNQKYARKSSELTLSPPREIHTATWSVHHSRNSRQDAAGTWHSAPPALAQPYRLKLPVLQNRLVFEESFHGRKLFLTICDHDMRKRILLLWRHLEALPLTRRKMASSPSPRTPSRCHGHLLLPQARSQP